MADDKTAYTGNCDPWITVQVVSADSITQGSAPSHDVLSDAVYDLPEALGAELVTDENPESAKRFEALFVVGRKAREARLTSGPACEAGTHVATFSRPEYVFVQVKKPHPDATVGLSFRSRLVKDELSGKVSLRTFVCKIADKGLFENLSLHYLREGDEVISVNNMSTLKMDATEIAALLKDCKTCVSITARNANGDPRTVASTVQKTNGEGPIGLHIRSNFAGSRLKIHDVNRFSLFSNTLLVAGHRCLEINGHSCDGMSATDAADCLRNSKSDLLTIVSRAPMKQTPRAVVLCREPQSKSLKSIFKQTFRSSRVAQPFTLH